MQRRSFITGILAAGIAPAVLSQGSAMRLWAPNRRLIDPTGIKAKLLKQCLENHFIAVSEDESCFVAVDQYGTRRFIPSGFLGDFKGKTRIVIYNEHWMTAAAI